MYLVFKIDKKRNREGLGLFPKEKIEDVILELEAFCEEGERIVAMPAFEDKEIKVRTASDNVFIKSSDGSITMKG